MENRKQHLERQLIANVIKDKCAHCDNILFEESWCTQERCIRFTLPIFRALFPPIQNRGDWNSGDWVMFEVNNNSDGFEIVCIFASRGFPKEYAGDREELLREFDGTNGNILWHSKCNTVEPNKIFEYFEDFLINILPTLIKKILKVFISPVHDEVLEEGAIKSITSTRYERNRKARALCLSYYGKTCKRCGLNFEQTYGEKYGDLIEVHHVVPISEIGEAYIVDPIKDLVPLCPNCHAMTHVEIKKFE
jgi:hypothetical protein